MYKLNITEVLNMSNFSPIARFDINSVNRGDRVSISTYRHPEHEGVKTLLVTDQPLRVGEPRPKPIFVIAPGTVVKVIPPINNSRFGSIRVKFDTPQFGFSLCEFPCYEENLIVGTNKDGSPIEGSYSITKINY